VKRIEQLKSILETSDKIGKIGIEHSGCTVELTVDSAKIVFIFDDTGDKLLGMVNWKE